jgi:hypothetical protein
VYSCALMVLAVLFGGLTVWLSVIGTWYPKSHTAAYDLALSETRLVSVDTTWIKSVSGGNVEILDHTPLNLAQNASDSVILMKFKEKPALDVLDTWNSTVPITIIPNDYYYWSWYFYHNSTLNVTWQYPVGVDMFFIKGENGYDDFVSGDYDDDDLIAGFLDFKSHNYSYVIPEDDFYFMFFQNSYSIYNVTGQFNFTAASWLFNTTVPVEACVLPCSLGVTAASDETFILVTPFVADFVTYGYGSENTDFLFTFSTHSRTWVPIVVMTIPAIFILALITIVIKCVWSPRPPSGYTTIQ